MNENSKIFGIGLSRTGTTSLHNALKLLGFKSKHFPFQLYNSDDYSILKEYEAFVDSPIPLIYKELDDMFPGSKFILTTRSLDSWLVSMKWLFEHGSALWNSSLKINKYRREFLGCDKFNKSILKKTYINYHEDVFKYFEYRNQDFLIMDIETNANFEKLCPFLNLPIIKSNYPRSNRKILVPLYKRLEYHYLKLNIKKAKSYCYSLKNFFR